MNGVTFENSGNKTFLVYKVQENDQLDTLGVGMITNNKLFGLAPLIYTQIDEERFFKYEISSKVTAKDFFSKPLDRKRILTVFSNIVAAIQGADEYMITMSNIVFHPDLMFINESSLDVSLVCIPILKNVSTEEDVINFFRTTIYGLQINKEENCNYFAQLFNYFNSLTSFSVIEFKDLLSSLATDERKEFSADINKTHTTAQYNQKTTAYTSCKDGGYSRASNNPPIAIQTPPLEKSIPTTQKPEKKKEKKISMFWLLQHYNEDNLKLYKEQKNGSNKSQKPKEKSSKKIKEKDPKDSNISVPDIPVPGVPTPPVIPNNNLKSEISPTPKVSSNKKKPLNQEKKAEIEVPTTQKNPDLYLETNNETTVLNSYLAGSGETTVLNMVTVKPRPYLVRLKNGEKVLIDKPRFRIGKEKSYVDYFIGDNTAISRSHADIIVRGDDYYLVDLNSTNHTFVNGAVVQNGEERQIKNGNRIRFANEEFEFIEEI